MALFDISKKVEGKLSDVVGKETAAKVMDKVEQTCGEALSGLCNIKVKTATTCWKPLPRPSTSWDCR